MSGLVPFTFEGMPVQVVEIDDVTWFAAPDVCRVLDIADVTSALRSLDEDEKGPLTVRTPGGDQTVNGISEPGLYKLIGRSRKPEAKRFDRWVRHEVLPSIRKTGGYGAPPLSPAEGVRELASVFGSLKKIARLAGLPMNQAILSASQATAKITGKNPLALVGVTYLEAPKNEALLGPADIGVQLGLKAQDVNTLLTSEGFQTQHRTRKGKIFYQPTPKGIEAGAEMQDTGKKQANGTPVCHLKWRFGIVERLRPLLTSTRQEA